MKNQNGVKNQMSDQERLELASKLDKELDDFINNLPKRERPDNKPMDDEWIEELQNHPFFMKKIPEPGDKLHPLYEGLQKLKYDPEENAPAELALAYKDDGNFNFKHKNYRLAILAYTEGIKAKSNDPELDASLYNNRSAANFFLKNYRSSLRDCELALKLKPNYAKTVIRAANCSFHMKKYDKAIEYCDIILDNDKENKEILELRKRCINTAKQVERDQRKREATVKKRELEEERLVNEIISRGVNVEGGKSGITLDKLEPCTPQLAQHRVYIDDQNHLIWPVVFLYPEYKIMDYIQEFNETTTFYDQICLVFEQSPEWDEQHKYKPNNLVIYFETNKRKIIEVPPTKTLQEILKLEQFVVKGGTPSFIVMVRDSPAHKRFMKNY